MRKIVTNVNEWFQWKSLGGSTGGSYITIPVVPI